MNSGDPGHNTVAVAAIRPSGNEPATLGSWPLGSWPLALLLLLGGCVPYQPPAPTPTQPPPTVTPTVTPTLALPQPRNAETLQALSQLTDLKDELRKLRNAVEELQFDTENTKRRQLNLSQDFDRRLLSLERAQRLLLLQPPVAGGTLPEGGVNPEGVVDNGTIAAIDGALTGGVDGADGTAGAVETPPEDIDVPGEAVSLQEQNLYDQAFDLLTQSKYQDAIDQFQQLADTWPDGGLSDDAYYWMAEARYVNREFEAALSGYRTVVTSYPDSERAPEALLKIGYIQHDIGTYEEAAETFRDIIEQYPGHKVAVSAQTRLRRIEQTIQYAE